MKHNSHNGNSFKIKGILFFRQQPILFLFIILVILGIFISPSFRTVLNMSNIARQVSVNGVIALGITIVIAGGGIDLSVESVAALSSIIIVLLVDKIGLTPSILIVLLFGLTSGLLTGFLIVKSKTLPIILTLGMWIFYRGLCLIATRNNPIYLDLESVKGFRFISEGSIAHIPISFIIFIILAIILIVFIKSTAIGRSILSIGGSHEASLLVGVRIQKIKILTYVISGLMSSIGGIILGSRVGAAQPLAASGSLIYIIAAVVIGGTSLHGGKAKIFGTLISVITIGLITNIFNLTSVNLEFQRTIYGAMILLVILSSKFLSSNNKIMK